VAGILAYYPRGRGFDSRTVQIFVCMYMSILGLGVSMYLYNMNVFVKIMFNVCNNPLSRIHNTSLISSYFGQDSRECVAIRIRQLFFRLPDVNSS
jgi:hypothetical protein